MLLKVIFAKQYKEHITELEPADKKIIENSVPHSTKRYMVSARQRV